MYINIYIFDGNCQLMITLLTTKYTSIVIELLILHRVCHMPSAWAPIDKKDMTIRDGYFET